MNSYLLILILFLSCIQLFQLVQMNSLLELLLLRKCLYFDEVNNKREVY